MLATKEEQGSMKQGSINALMAKRWINGYNRFAAKSKLITLLRVKPFHGFASDDADKHMERILEIVEPHRSKHMSYN